MLRVTVLFLFSSLAAFVHADTVLSSGPFQGVDIATLSAPQRETVTQASEDFERVLRGKPPKHATFDAKAPLPLDGGTQFFVGKEYKLTIVKSLSSFGGTEGTLDGYIYGPVVTFSKSFAIGNMSDVVSLRFYTSKQLQKLMSNK